MFKPRFWICLLVLTALMSWGGPAEASVFHFSGIRPSFLGVKEGKLSPCPPTPNCVSSQSADAAHRIAPLSLPPDRADAIVQLNSLLAAQPNVTIVESTDTYLYAEFTSDLMGFVDDVEFYVPKDGQGIEVRSASRLGESDLGVNRDRIEALRAHWQGMMESKA